MEGATAEKTRTGTNMMWGRRIGVRRGEAQKHSTAENMQKGEQCTTGRHSSTAQRDREAAITQYSDHGNSSEELQKVTLNSSTHKRVRQEQEFSMHKKENAAQEKRRCTYGCARVT